MGDSGTERSGFEFEAAHEANSHVASGMMALDNDEFQDVALNVGHDLAIFQTYAGDDLAGDDLVGNNFDDADFRRLPGCYLEIPGRVAQVHRAARLGNGGGLRPEILALIGNENTFFVGLAN